MGRKEAKRILPDGEYELTRVRESLIVMGNCWRMGTTYTAKSLLTGEIVSYPSGEPIAFTVSEERNA